MPGAFDGRLSIHIHGCRDLKRVQLLGKMDPYVKLQFREEKFKTKVAKDEHTNPVFDQEFVFNVKNASDHDLLFIYAYNDEIGADDMIGRASIPMHQIPTMRQGEKFALELFDPENFRKITGYVDITLRWQDANAQPGLAAYQQPPQVVAQPQPQVVYQPQPQVAYQPQPQVVYQPQPQVVYQPAPAPQVVYQLPPEVVYQPPPYAPHHPPHGPHHPPHSHHHPPHIPQQPPVVQAAYEEKQPIEDGVYFIRSKHSGKVLDVSGASKDNGGVIHLWDFHGGDNQKFHFRQVYGDVYTIQAVHSGKYVDVSGVSKNNGAALHQWEYTGAENQKFRLVRKGGGFQMMAVHSNKAIDVSGGNKTNGTKIHQWDLHGGDNQIFTFEAAGKLADGVYFIRAKHSGKVLDVDGGSKDNGAKIIQWDFHGGNNQKFHVRKINHRGSSDVYSIQSLHSGKYVDVSGVSKDNGANVHQWASTTGDNQKFRLIPNGSGYHIIALHSGKALDISGGSKDGGAKLIQYDLHRGDNQTFLFEKAR